MTISSQASKALISQDGRTAVVSISVSFLQRGGRKQILSPAGAAPWSPAPRVDSALVKAVVPLLAKQAGPCRQGCDHALETALITASDHRDPALVARLDAVAGRVLKK